jgi:rod shape-determining protein MreC
MHNPKRKKFTLIIILTSLFFFVANRIFFYKKGMLENIASNITYPVLWLSSTISQPIKYFFQRKQSYNELQKQYIQLKENYENLQAENIKLNASMHFEEKTYELLDFQKRYNYENKLLAKILSKNITQEEHSFLIDQGSNNGIEKNMVALYKFQIIGKVTQVFRWYSKVLLITDHNCKIAAYTNTTNAGGIVVGKNDINYCNFEYVSHLSKIKPNDLVISSGQGLIFPEGFCLGQITKSKIEGLYHKITIEPLVDIKTLDYCLLTNQEKINSF